MLTLMTDSAEIPPPRHVRFSGNGDVTVSETYLRILENGFRAQSELNAIYKRNAVAASIEHAERGRELIKALNQLYQQQDNEREIRELREKVAALQRPVEWKVFLRRLAGPAFCAALLFVVLAAWWPR